jgi:hypothetical protein
MINGPSRPTNPGWYPDAQRPDQVRWWDGRQWTVHVQPRRQLPRRHWWSSVGSRTWWLLGALAVLILVPATILILTLGIFSGPKFTTAEYDYLFAIKNSKWTMGGSEEYLVDEGHKICDAMRGAPDGQAYFAAQDYLISAGRTHSDGARDQKIYSARRTLCQDVHEFP